MLWREIMSNIYLVSDDHIRKEPHQCLSPTNWLLAILYGWRRKTEMKRSIAS